MTHLGSTQKYWYDPNGNQITRIVGTDTFNLIYDGENRLVEVKKNGVSMATFVYDGEGRRVKSTINGTTTYFIGAHYEVTGSQITKYYFAGTQRVAMRKYTIPQSMTVEYFLGDHLGSTSITTDNTGAKVSEMRYKPWGEVRSWWTAGLATTPAYKLPDYTFTGQFSYMDDPSTTGVTEGFGLMFYQSRFYDPALGRFSQADSIIPDNIHGYDRYNYVSNRPTIMTDPTGHMEWNDNEGTRPKPPCAKEAKKSAKSRMDSISISKTSTMDTYTVANIALQKGPGRYQPFSEFFKGSLASEGPAKVTDMEMETPYGELINDGHNGVGLGLRMTGEPLTDLNDQNVLAVAITAMATRIQVRLDMCDGKKFSCTSTDRFLGAALGGDNGILPSDLQNLRNGIDEYGKPDPTTGIFQWGAYLDAAKNKSHNLSVIQQFVDNVAYLQDHGAAVPDVDWTYVCGLLEK